MADVLKTPDGVITVFEKVDVVDVIRRYVSDDVADYVEREMKYYDEQENLDKLYFESDYKSMEASCDEYTAALNDINDETEVLFQLIDAKRLDKKKLFDAVMQIQKKCLELL
jgi:hypothetical protein